MHQYPDKVKAEIEKGDMEAFPDRPGYHLSAGPHAIDYDQGDQSRNRSIFLLPTHKLDTAIDAIPAIIGSLMAKNSKLAVGDYVTIRWRDANGTFDATEITDHRYL